MFRSVLLALVLAGCSMQPADSSHDQLAPPDQAVAHGLGDFAPGHEANGMAECVGEFRICRREGLVPTRECAHTFRDCVQALERPEDSGDTDDSDDEEEEEEEPPVEEPPAEEEPPVEEEPPADEPAPAP